MTTSAIFIENERGNRVQFSNGQAFDPRNELGGWPLPPGPRWIDGEYFSPDVDNTAANERVEYVDALLVKRSSDGAAYLPSKNPGNGYVTYVELPDHEGSPVEWVGFNVGNTFTLSLELRGAVDRSARRFYSEV